MFPAEPVPDAIGSYKILRRLAGPGMAEVYLAKAQGPMGFERECELKLMADTSDGDASYAEELAREAAICARLNNPAVVRVFDFFEHHGKLVLAMEHVEGHTLADLLQFLAEKSLKLGDQGIFHIGARIASALADAHAATDEQGSATPIIHRNLSPDTVLVSVDGDVRLTGFGVGKILGRTPDTAIGRIKGTPGYMAPEQARGEPVTTKADVYGLGLLLWSLLAAKRPPTDGTWPRRISGLRNDLPREVAALVDSALDHFPGTRKITAREIEQWLSKAAQGAKGKTELRDKVAAMRAEMKDAAPPPPSSRRRIASVGSPYQGVRFGPPPSARTSGGPHGPPSSSPRPASSTAPAVRSRMPTVTGVGKPAFNLPPPPPEDPSPSPPPRETGTMPSRALAPANAAFVEPDEEPISVPPASAAPTTVPAPAAVVPRPTPPVAPPARVAATRSGRSQPPPAGATPMGTVLLAPVLPLAPAVAQAAAPPPAAAQPPATVAFGAPPAGTPGPSGTVAFAAVPAPTPAPAAVAFGAPPAGTPAPAAVSFGAPPAGTPAPGAVSFGAPPAATPVAAPVVAPAVLSMPFPAVGDPPKRKPLPSLLTIGPGRRSLSAMGAMVVSAITATVVVVVALVFFVRRDKTPVAPAATSASAPVVATAPTPPPPAATVHPSASASATPSAADLPFGYGYLTVASPAAANVYVSGKLAGPVNKPLKVRCGTWFIRLAAPQEGGRYPEWVTGGETAVVPCQESTRLELGPKRP